jgi:hypothetical protein
MTLSRIIFEFRNLYMHFVFPNKVLYTLFAAGAFLVSGNAAANSLVVESIESSDLTQRVEALEAKAQASSATAFNPSITAFGNVLGCFSPSATDSQHIHEGCPNTIFLRELELDFRATIAPGVDGVVILALEQEHPGDFSAGVEEAYALLKPSYFEVKLGRVLSSFGRINRIHTHDLPQMTRPLSAINFLGEHGLAQDGASAEVLIPTPGESNALTLNAEVLFGTSFSKKQKAANEGSLPLAGPNTLPKFMGRLSWFFDLGNGHDMDIGGSTLLQPRDGGPLFQLYGADFNYRWVPYILGAKKSFLLGGEMYAVNNGSNTYFDTLPIGGFAWTQLQLNQNTYFGLRYSYDQGVTKDHKLNTAAGVFLTYYTTEFLRVRAGYERVSNDIAFKDGRDQFMIELNFIFGSHLSEPYWVNR